MRVWKDEDRRDRGCARFVGGGAHVLAHRPPFMWLLRVVAMGRVVSGWRFRSGARWLEELRWP